MSEDTNNDFVEPTELESLQARARQMGIKFHPNAGVETLKERIKEATADKAPAAPVVSEPTGPVVETAAMKTNRIKKEQTALKRIRITCMNPAKTDWEGEIFTVGNKATGSLKKYVPFNVEYHVPVMMLEMIKSRKCQVFYTVVNKVNNQKSRKGKLVREFAVEHLDDLTREELKDLAQRQAMANGTSD